MIYMDHKMDQNQRMDSGERYAQRRPEKLISKYEKIKNTLNHFYNLPTALKPLSLLSTLQCLEHKFREVLRSAFSSARTIVR